MSKRNGDNFQNRAARKFKDNPKIDRLSQEEIFEILDEDMSTILQQVTDHRNHKNGAKYPTYTSQMFANLSVPLYFYRYVKDHVKPNFKKGKIKTDLSDDQVESLRQILADAYKRSATNQYNQQQEFQDRNKLISRAFEILEAKNRKLAKKLDGLKKRQIRDLLIQVYTDPAVNFRYVRKIIDESTASDKVKLKVLRGMYGKRFVQAAGAALTIESNRSDCIDMIFQFINKKKAKKRAKYIRAYADAYKIVGTHNSARVNNAFKYKNRKIIRELKMIDIGYKKAFKNLKGEDPKKKKRKDETVNELKAEFRKRLDQDTTPKKK